ncbi:tripartite tricarboxylate transporter substrate binding protein [Achromobacter pulmonis]|uniref:Tripartite tricarboxylate transporter substrate binding protein n=1 Tax=Achromobacter pulmonis TaxID=1389932 RepID=A0A2N8KP39_9BURK|nr:tripartite tricarboxylate transporter substrate binding protein [Achromobacter pulmonis]MBO9329263.1 tripartite tricarboxylate transporter substrate binding protein [Achromobacter xylosoxidans]PND35199.1 tripartite tricarboxylate transporter substrate binding protein [Achromobacter pulmonis]
MVSIKQMFAGLALAALQVLPGSGLAAPAWPERPVTVVIAYPAGGAADVVARIVLNELAANLGQPFIAESRPGANSNIGAEWVARARPDGYTLLVSGPWFAINQYIETGRRWQPDSLVPVARFALTDNLLAVPASAPYRDLAGYVAHARGQTDPPLQYASPGAGSTQRMAAELFLAQAGIKVDSVQYKGAPPIIPDLVSGRVSMAVLAAANVTSLIQAGKLKGLATFGETRGPSTPDIPTMAEQGYPKAVVTSWFGLHAPAGTPPEVIRRLSDSVGKVVSKPAVQAALRAADAQPAFLDSQDFAAYIRSQQTLWQELAADLEGKK